MNARRPVIVTAWVLAVLLICLVPGAALAARLWTLVATPLTATVGVPMTVTLNVQNIGGSGGGDEIGCVQVNVPTASFMVSSAAVVSVKGQASGHGWQAWTAPNGSAVRVTFQNPPDNNVLVGLPVGDRAVFRITGTPTTAGLVTWNAVAFDKPGSGDDRCGSGTFPTLAVTLTVALPALPPTPTPTPPPTPAPTVAPSPTATPTPTPRPSPTPTPVLPLPSLTVPPLPLPTLTLPPPLPTLLATPRPSATPSPRPGETTAPSASASGQPGASGRPADPGSSEPPGGVVPPGSGGRASDGPGGGGGSSGAGGSGGSSGAAGNGSGAGWSDADGPVFSIGGDGPDPVVPMTNAEFAGFDSIDWAVPALTLSVPGLLLIIAVMAQLTASAVWLPMIRRWLGAFGVGRRKRRSAGHQA